MCVISIRGGFLIAVYCILFSSCSCETLLKAECLLRCCLGNGWVFQLVSLSLSLSGISCSSVCVCARVCTCVCVKSRVPASMGKWPSEQLGLSAASASPSTLHLVFEHLAGRGHVDPVPPPSPPLPRLPFFLKKPSPSPPFALSLHTSPFRSSSSHSPLRPMSLAALPFSSNSSSSTRLHPKAEWLMKSPV